MPQRLDQLGWLTGTWRSVGDEAHSQTHWTEAAGGMMVGLSLELKADGETFYEFMRIEESSEGLTLQVSSKSERPVDFALRDIDGERVEFQRQFPDFPSLVAYWIDDAELCAKIEGLHHGRRRTMKWRWARL